MKTQGIVGVGLITLLSLTAVQACGRQRSGEGTTPGIESTQRTLYERLGGQQAITAVVEDFAANLRADNRINARFANADMNNLKTKLVEQICAASGGPCIYTGKSMVEAHTGMDISEDEFNALVEDLVKSLDKLAVRDREKNELLAALGGMKGDIVGK